MTDTILRELENNMDILQAINVFFPDMVYMSAVQSILNKDEQVFKGLGRLWIETKEFEESEHPRDKEGKFTDKNKVDTLAKVAVGVAAVGLVYKGYKIYKTSAVWKRAAGNPEKVKKQIEEITSGLQKLADTRPKFNDTTEHIVNLKIEDLTEKSKLNPFQKKILDYLHNTTQWQKDLAEAFSNKEGWIGPREITVRNVDLEEKIQKLMEKNVIAPTKKNKKDLLMMQHQYCTSYSPYTDSLNVNLLELERLYKSGQPVAANPKALFLHEYMHGIVCNNPEVITPYLIEMERKVKQIKTIKSVTPLGEWEFEVEHVFLKKIPTSPVPVDLLVQEGIVNKNVAQTLDKSFRYQTVLTLKPSEATAKRFHLSQPMTRTMSLRQLFQETAGSRNMKINNWDNRVIYGLQDSSEYLATKVEVELL